VMLIATASGLPAFVKVTVLVVLVPTLCVPKSKVLGETVIEVFPVPLVVMTLWPARTLSTMVSVAEVRSILRG